MDDLDAQRLSVQQQLLTQRGAFRIVIRRTKFRNLVARCVSRRKIESLHHRQLGITDPFGPAPQAFELDARIGEVLAGLGFHLLGGGQFALGFQFLARGFDLAQYVVNAALTVSRPRKQGGRKYQDAFHTLLFLRLIIR